MKIKNIFIILCIFLLLLLTVYFMTKMSSFEETASSCESQGGTCVETSTCMAVERLPVAEGECEKGVCCV